MQVHAASPRRKRKKFQPGPGRPPSVAERQCQQWRQLLEGVQALLPEPAFSAGPQARPASAQPSQTTEDRNLQRLAYLDWLSVRRAELSASIRQINTLDGASFPDDDQLQDQFTRLGPSRTNLPVWRDIHPRTRMAVLATAAHLWGGLAFSLNLGPESQDRLMVTGLPDADWLRTSLTRAFERHTGAPVEFALHIELQDAQGVMRPHMHGVLIPGELPHELIREALHQAGGEWGSPHHRQRQVDLRQITDGPGWGAYLTKQSGAMSSLTAARDLTAVTWGLLRAGRDLYAAVRGLYDRLDDARRDRGLIALRLAVGL